MSEAAQPLFPTIEEAGFALLGGWLDDSEVEALLALLGNCDTAGKRGMLGDPSIRKWATSPRVLEALAPHLPGPPRPVRAIYFNKTAETNWLVPWHQDLTIAVQERVETAGFGPWSVKEGLTHVQPPPELLAQMLTLRLHLDATDDRNGALRLLPGSHRCGKLTASEIERVRQTTPEWRCHCQRGDALLMRPLTLHASARSTSTRPRRILHIEYTGGELPAGLEWNSLA